MQVDKKTQSDNTQRIQEDLKLYQAELEQQNEELRHANIAMERLREKYFHLFVLSPVPCVVLGKRGQILETNRQAARLFTEKTPSVQTKLHFDRFLDSSQQQVFRDHLEKVFASPAMQTCRLLMKLGHDASSGEDEPRILDVSSSRLHSGDMPTCLTTLVDHTEELRAREKLRHREERLRFALEAANDGIWDWHIPTSRVYYSPRYFTMLGYQPEGWAHDLSTWAKLLHPDEVETLSSQVLDMVRRDDGFELSFRMMHADGTLRWILSRAKCVERDANGSPVRMVGTHTDITESRTRSEQLQESEERLRLALETAEIGTWSWDVDADRDTRDANLNRILGLPAEGSTQSVGDFASRVHPDDRHDVLEALHTAIEQDQPYTCEFRIARPDGSIRWVRDRGLMIEHGGRKRMTGAIIDITPSKVSQAERERLIEQLELKNAELERFTYSVSHDLKSPLITLKGFLGRMEKDLAAGETSRMTERMERMHFAADKMKELLDGVLELSRVGRLVVPDKRVDLGEVVSEVQLLLAGPIRECGADLQWSPDLPVVRGDPVRLREVMQNLIENSLKFSAAHAPPVIRIRALPVPEEEFVLIEVSDNGPGVEEAYREKIFGLFEKLDSRTPGGGVGLSLTQRIVEYHGGRIWVEAYAPGDGCRMRLTLPQFIDRPEKAGEQPEQTPEGSEI